MTTATNETITAAEFNNTLDAVLEDLPGVNAILATQ